MHDISGLPLVSIIVTTYNRSKLVCETIDSILAQDYPNFEVIVVDDHSSDNTLEILAKYGSKIVTRAHEQNQGVQIASMTGFAASSGKYLCFTGDDDIWKARDKITRQVDVLEKDTAGRYGITTCAVQEFGGPGATVKPRKWPRNLRAHLMAGNGIIYGSAAMLRREAFTGCGGFDPKQVKGTDSDVFRRIVLNGWDVHFDPTPMIDYRIGDGRMTTLNLLGLRRTISAQGYVLQKFSLLWPSYKRAAKKRMAAQAKAHLQLYKLTGSQTAKQGALAMTLRSMSLSRSWLSLLYRIIVMMLLRRQLDK